MIDFAQERMKAKLLKLISQQEDGCWLWLGGVVRNSKRHNTEYGYIEVDRKRLSVRRVIYNLYKDDLGNKIVYNTCTTKGCINPDHLCASSQRKSGGPPKGKRK